MQGKLKSQEIERSGPTFSRADERRATPLPGNEISGGGVRIIPPQQEALDFSAILLLPISILTYDMLTDFITYVILLHMSIIEKLETVWFTTKGQVVIPLRLRKQFDIEDGTKAVVQATPEGILLKPMTAALIKRGRGILKRTPGGRRLTEDWAEHNKQERAVEERHAG